MEDGKNDLLINLNEPEENKIAEGLELKSDTIFNNENEDNDNSKQKNSRLDSMNKLYNKQVWVNNIKADGGAYKGCPKNDYCQHFVDTNERPQNFIRDYDEEKRFIDYPKLNELIKRKNEILTKRATPAMYLKTDLKTFDLTTLGKFDVILIDPPWEDYVVKDGVKTSDNFWSYEEIADLKIETLSEACSFLFLWVGNGKGLDYGRALLKKWGFRRCEDIVWIKTNKHSSLKKPFKDNSTLLQRTKEHCLVGIKGQVKRGSDRHFIHANIDTDVIVGEESPDSTTEKPHELYRIIERFCLGRKRLELFGEDHNIRNGWLTLGKNISSSNFDIEKYNNWFVGEGMYPEIQSYEGGRYVGCTPEVESLRPRSPQRTTSTSQTIKPPVTPLLNKPQTILPFHNFMHPTVPNPMMNMYPNVMNSRPFGIGGMNSGNLFSMMGNMMMPMNRIGNSGILFPQNQNQNMINKGNNN